MGRLLAQVGTLLVIISLLSACAAPGVSPSLSPEPSAEPTSSAGRGECTLVAYPSTIEVGGASVFIGDGFRYGSEITLTLVFPNDPPVVFRGAELADLKVTDGAGFAVQFTSEGAKAGDTIGLEATDGRCNATASWTMASPGELPSPSTAVSTACDGGRSPADRPDEVDGYQVHLVYALAADSLDRESDITGDLARGVGYANDWMTGQTDGSHFRFDTCGGGEVDVSFVRLPAPESLYLAARGWRLEVMSRDLAAAGFDDPNKIYAVWWGGIGAHCGGEAPAVSQPGAAVWLYARDLIGDACQLLGGSPTAYPNLDLIHEIIHALGMVARCAPHTTDEEPTHVTEPADLMNNDFSAIEEIVLDRGNDDYFGHDIVGCPDLADSAFLEPLPSNPVLPTGWE
jgi:hypothetical protein